MTQQPLLAITWAIDASSIMELDNAHIVLSGMEKPPPRFTESERTAIWAGLERLAGEGRLKLLDKIEDDLERWYPDVLSKLRAFPNVRIRTTPQIRATYQQIIAKHPKLMQRLLHHDDADPYLVAAAKTRGYGVVTEEKDNATRKSKSKDVPIPDLCALEGVQCRNLRNLGKDEGWIT